MPGRLLHRIALRLCRAEADRVLEPLIADLQREWSDAKPGSGRAFALARAYASFWSSITLCAARTVLRGAVAPVDRGMTTSATVAFVYAVLGVTLLRSVGVRWWYWQQPLSALILNEMSAWVALSAFATVPAFMYARREPDRRWDATASRLLVVTTLIAIASAGWLGPALFAASEHGHGHFLDRQVQPSFESMPTIIRMVRQHATDADWQYFLNARLAMITDAVLLGLIGWQLSGIRRPGIGRAMFWWFTLMELVLVSGASSHDGPGWLVWRASGILVLILLALHATRRNRSDRPALPDRPASAALPGR
jgi:hypothetical protein